MLRAYFCEGKAGFQPKKPISFSLSTSITSYQDPHSEHNWSRASTIIMYAQHTPVAVKGLPDKGNPFRSENPNLYPLLVHVYSNRTDLKLLFPLSCANTMLTKICVCESDVRKLKNWGFGYEAHLETSVRFVYEEVIKVINLLVCMTTVYSKVDRGFNISKIDLILNLIR